MGQSSRPCRGELLQVPGMCGKNKETGRCGRGVGGCMCVGGSLCASSRLPAVFPRMCLHFMFSSLLLCLSSSELVSPLLFTFNFSNKSHCFMLVFLSSLLEVKRTWKLPLEGDHQITFKPFNYHQHKTQAGSVLPHQTLKCENPSISSPYSPLQSAENATK